MVFTLLLSYYCGGGSRDKYLKELVLETASEEYPEDTGVAVRLAADVDGAL